jgi:intracellular septation protein
MKLLFDFLPIVVFFIAFKIWGIFAATALTMATSVLQVGSHWLRHQTLERMHLITLVLVVGLGTATLLFHNAMFIKWKPTAIYWAFAVAFLASQYFSSKPLIQYMMESKLQLSSVVWRKINLWWAGFFLAMGALNLFVVYNFSTDFWVNFKLFGTLGLSLIFVILQSLYMARYFNKKVS